MALAASRGKGVVYDARISSAIRFLKEVYDKGISSNDTSLRAYLIKKHGLSNSEVDKAFTIHRKALEEDMGTDNRQTKHETAERMVKHTDIDGHENKAEELKAMERATNTMSFLLENKQAIGKNLYKEFMKDELEYCNVLKCLCDEYCKSLIKMSADRQFRMKYQEIEKMFNRVQKLYNFHNYAFYNQLTRDTHVMKPFLRFFKTFGGYIEYMKECVLTVKKIRQYIWDKNLHKCLEEIKQKSKLPNHDMIDLLLCPLDRMSAYKMFLDRLYEWTDEKQKGAYNLICKAKKRFEKLAMYIEKYKFVISNQIEMTRVQQFLSKQCHILVPSRRIVRRGMMIRRTSGWTAKDKQYIFFLFNDILLWALKTGALKNVVILRECEVMETDSLENKNRKFRVESIGHKNKVLHLECETERQRNEWFNAIKTAISRERDALQDNSTSDVDPLKIEGLEDMLKNTSTESIDVGSTRNSFSGSVGTMSSARSGLWPTSDDLHFNRWDHSLNFPYRQSIDLSTIGGSLSLSEYSSYDDEKLESPSSPKKIQSPSSSERHRRIKIERVNSKKKESNNFRPVSTAKVENKDDEHDLNLNYSGSQDPQFEKNIRSPSGKFSISRSPRRRNQQDTSTSSPPIRLHDIAYRNNARV